jgi:hypothetical protein
MTSFPPFITLTVPVLNDFLQRISPTFKFTYTFRYQRFRELARFYIGNDLKEEIAVLLDFIDPQLTPKDPPVIVHSAVSYAVCGNHFDCALFLIDRCPRLDLLEHVSHGVCFYTILELAYHVQLKGPTPLPTPSHRQFLLQLIRRGCDVVYRVSFYNLIDHIKVTGKKSLHAYRGILLKDVQSVRLLLTLVSIYSIKRLGQQSHIIKAKLPLDTIRKLVDFIRDK